MRVKLFQLRGMLSGPRILYTHIHIYVDTSDQSYIICI
ncbi:unnamed protein product [Brassica rapa]|uniref:Uncharacterized protein n=1 Tax=Brassica campestris TaxID=3711 RepID=A0A8D9D6F8_BRACM|nr:unnamed protein product [Brassica rapa]